MMLTTVRAPVSNLHQGVEYKEEAKYKVFRLRLPPPNFNFPSTIQRKRELRSKGVFTICGFIVETECFQGIRNSIPDFTEEMVGKLLSQVLNHHLDADDNVVLYLTLTESEIAAFNNTMAVNDLDEIKL